MSKAVKACVAGRARGTARPSARVMTPTAATPETARRRRKRAARMRTARSARDVGPEGDGSSRCSNISCSFGVPGVEVVTKGGQPP